MTETTTPRVEAGALGSTAECRTGGAYYSRSGLAEGVAA